MGSKTLQIHWYYRSSQEHSSSTFTLQALILNDIVGYRWRENGLATLWGAIIMKTWLLWVFRLLENVFATIADLKMLNNTDGHTKLKPQSPCTFMQISLYIILLTRSCIPSKITFPVTFRLRIVSKFPTIIVASHLKSVTEQTTRHFLTYETNVKFQSSVRHQFYNFCTTEECVYS